MVFNIIVSVDSLCTSFFYQNARISGENMKSLSRISFILVCIYFGGIDSAFCAPEQDKADTPATQDRRTSSETNGAMPEQPQPEISSANVGEQPVIVPVEAEKDQPAPSGEEEAQPARRRRRRYPGSEQYRDSGHHPQHPADDRAV